MDRLQDSTRVRAPENTPVVSSSLASDDSIAFMTNTGQSPSQGEARVPTTARISTTTHCRRNRWDLRKSIKIGTWNVITLHAPEHQVALSRELNKLNVTLAGLQETRITGQGKLTVEDSILLYSGGDSHSHGVGLMLRGPSRDALQSWTLISPRLLTARLRHRHGNMSVIVAYAPTETSDDVTKDDFYESL